MPWMGNNNNLGFPTQTERLETICRWLQCWVHRLTQLFLLFTFPMCYIRSKYIFIFFNLFPRSLPMNIPPSPVSWLGQGFRTFVYWCKVQMSPKNNLTNACAKYYTLSIVFTWWLLYWAEEKELSRLLWIWNMTPTAHMKVLKFMLNNGMRLEKSH
jgi:hypothetical protein